MSHYIHGSDPSEQSRLSRMNDLINERCFSKINLEGGMRVLDVGSGLGQFTHKISKAIGNSGFCLGIERDPNQLALARKNFTDANLEFRPGDALNLPLGSKEIGNFDLAHSRFLLEHLPNPAKAIAEMLRALRPGGKIFLLDDDHQTLVLFPEPAGFHKLWTAYMDSYIEVGNDPFIGRKLTKLMVDQGVKNIRNDMVFFGDCAGTETFALYVDNLIGVIATSLDVMTNSKLISEDEYHAAIRNIQEWASLPGASLWYTICVAEGVK